MISFKEGSQNQRTFKATSEMAHKFKVGARRGFKLNGDALVADVRQKMTKKNKSGRVYLIYRGLGGRRLKNARRHVASGAGEYPSVISGNLRKSVDFRVKGSTRLEFGAGGGKVNYAKFLEEGTSQIKERRFLRQTMRSYQNQFKTTLNREINKSMGI